MNGRLGRAGALAAFACGALLAAACKTPPPPPTPGSVNVLLVTVDTLRPDRLSCYGYKGRATPNIDRLAAAGVLFENAYCDVPWTTPSMASVHTGLYAIHHGLKSSFQQLDDANVTLAEVLKSKGYTTAAFIGSFPVDSSFKFNQGFDVFDEEFDTPSVVDQDGKPKERIRPEFHESLEDQRLFQFRKAHADAFREDTKVSDASIEWLKQKPKRPFFLWVHYFGPHERHDARLSFMDANAKMVDEYDPLLAKSDVAVGRLLDALAEFGLDANTLVILHADHGQSLGEQYYFGHGVFLYDATLRIPLLIRFPGQIDAGTRVSTMARNVDILPTVLELAGYGAPDGLDGRSLVAALRGRDNTNDRVAMYCETYLSATEGFAEEVRVDGKPLRVGFVRRGVRTPDWLYVVNEPAPFIDYSNPPPVPASVVSGYRKEELFDMRNDPAQAANIIGNQPAAAAGLRRKLAAYLETSRPPSAHRELDAAAKERLRSLGYME